MSLRKLCSAAMMNESCFGVGTTSEQVARNIPQQYCRYLPGSLHPTRSGFSLLISTLVALSLSLSLSPFVTPLILFHDRSNHQQFDNANYLFD